MPYKRSRENFLMTGVLWIWSASAFDQYQFTVSLRELTHNTI